MAVFVGPTHDLEHANDRWRTATGLPAHEELRKYIAQVYQSGAPIQLATLGAHPTRPGLEAHCVATLDPVHGCFGTVIGVVVTCTSMAGEVHPEDTRRCGDLDAQKPGPAIEARLRGPDGQWRWHRLQLDRHWLVATDINDSRGADLKRDHYLSVVCHELRTPLMSMMLWESVLGDPSADPDLRKRALDAIHDGVTTQSRILGDMLDVSRAANNKLFVAHHPVAVEAILRDAIAAVTADADAKHIAVQTEIGALGEARGDARRIRQIFDNLMSNAIKFTAPDGTVSIHGRRETSQVVIEVRDTGCGISLDYLPHVFEPFSQSDDALARREGGLGLGLAISEHLARLHHGSLRATSGGVGHGATFTLTIPAVDPSEPRTASTLALSAARVLVIDDDVHVRDALTRLLSRVGASVDSVDSAEAARTAIAARPPNVVICDIAMRGEDGYHFVTWLRARDGDERALPAIALSAYDRRADVERAYEAGFDVYLVKPINIDTLVTNIEALLQYTRE
ncbi:MAG: histidine kinase [Myxococcales bacterium]|nr:histidine kinase [Myxococcales bacterium]